MDEGHEWEQKHEEYGWGSEHEDKGEIEKNRRIHDADERTNENMNTDENTGYGQHEVNGRECVRVVQGKPVRKQCEGSPG